MPKAQTTKVFRREDFVYTPDHPNLPLSSVSNNPLNTAENGGSRARATVNSIKPESVSNNRTDVESFDTASDIRTCYPRGDVERQKYRTKAGKKVTQHQWDVYDFILKIPRGKVTTYKIISESIGGSARSVGGALRNNPFSPYVPCHRVVASNLFIGGFCGEWAGRESSDKAGTKKLEEKEQLQIKRKIRFLKEEGVEVDQKGFLMDKQSAVWRPAQTSLLAED